MRALLLAGGIVAALLLAEGVVRLFALAPEVVLVQQGRFRLSPNERIGYEPVPDFDYAGKMDSFHDYVGRSNALGFRDRDHETEKPAGVTRILLLGDSVTAGQGVRDFERTYPAILEERLLAAGLDVEVLNFAVTGYNTQQEVWTLADKGLAFDPDLVLVGFCLNDRHRSDGGVMSALMEQQEGAAGLLRSRVRSHPLLLESALYRLVRYRALAAATGSPSEPTRDDTVDESLALLARLANEHGFRVMLAVFPRFGRLLDYPYLDEHERVLAQARRLGFASFDLLPALQRCRRERGRLAFDLYHPNAAGHRCAGDALARAVLARGRDLGLPADPVLGGGAAAPAPPRASGARSTDAAGRT